MAEPLPDPVTIPGMAPWLVAFVRAGALAVGAALLEFVAVSRQSHDPWVIIPAMVAAVLAAFGYGGAAAFVDTARANNAAANSKKSG